MKPLLLFLLAFICGFIFIARMKPQTRNFTNTDKAEALGVLGLKPSASREQIIETYRKRMRTSHPDYGGDQYVAARLNWAKDVLIDKAS